LVIREDTSIIPLSYVQTAALGHLLGEYPLHTHTTYMERTLHIMDHCFKGEAHSN
jgi:hypothetical protein